MATITLTVPDPDVPRVVAAYEAKFGTKQGGETNADFIKRILADQTNALVRSGEIQAAQEQARDDFVEIPIT